jgi:hypothetical protein
MYLISRVNKRQTGVINGIWFYQVLRSTKLFGFFCPTQQRIETAQILMTALDIMRPLELVHLKVMLLVLNDLIETDHDVDVLHLAQAPLLDKRNMKRLGSKRGVIKRMYLYPFAAIIFEPNEPLAQLGRAGTMLILVLENFIEGTEDCVLLGRLKELLALNANF